jgi:YVTN family beta-propeller protein
MAQWIICLIALSMSILGGCKPAKTENVYAHTQTGMIAPAAQSALPRVYVPNSLDNTVSVIDPATYQVINTWPTGKNPQHIVPSYDLKTLWILNDKGNSITAIDPNTATPGEKIHVDDPYNLYFTPDGQFAIVIDEAYRRFDFRDPQTMALRDAVSIKCKGLNHLDFTADGRYALATCEFSGQLLKLDVANHKIVGYLTLGSDSPGMGSMPQDIRLSPNGRLFYVADMTRGGVFLIDPVKFTQVGFIKTGIGTHSIYPSRNSPFFYIANRGCAGMGCRIPDLCPAHGPGSISVLDTRTQKIVAQWPIPGGGSPDMGNLSADGKELWLSGRYDNEVYVFDTTTGQLTHRIPVGKSPHGLSVWPQPGRYSLGHTGNMR